MQDRADEYWRHALTRLTRLAGTVLALMVGCGAVAMAQKNPYLRYTERHFVENMQSAGRNYGAVTDLLAKGDYESAKAQLTRAREQLAITVTFWRDLKKDDAARMLRSALTGMDDLDLALSEEKIDPPAIKSVSQRINTACQACHVVYREQDPVTKAYRVKPGAIR